ncbi:hypothetical protein G6O67_008826 [Ophiocordyceps sinensis]|uniref:Ubiquitin-like 1-activating enzyme E1A n=1 Tax=Ophiocordyceps sinensis TaxID=72228 RepID=A0A8H4PMN3_9HYPO|nr:hypothetical protein G6O67_008826 [Ophiocordyceps sinensis]
MEQQRPNQTDAATLPSPGSDAQGGGIPPFNPQLLNHANPPAMAAATMARQPVLHHQTSASMPVQEANLLLPANGNAPIQPQPDNKTVSADDIALYDRQIRLWGMAAQAKIQNANILLITIRALANEIAKNLVLAGIGSLTLLDGSTVTEADLGAQFFLADGGESVVGHNRAEAACAGLRKLNPRVQIHVDTEGVTTKGPGYFAGYDVVIATDLDPDTFNIINTATRINGKAFYAAGTHGMYGFIFSDLIEHDFVIERVAGNVATGPAQETRTRSILHVKTKVDNAKTVEFVTKRELYSTWFLASDLAMLPDEYIKSKRRLKNVTPTLPCLRALWEFGQLKGGALPSNREDLKLFTQIATQKHKALSLPSETLRPEFLRSFLQNLGSEIAPVAAILGGQLAQDVINVLGQTQQPIQNMVIFDGDRMEAAVYSLHPEGALGAGLLSLGNNNMTSNGGSMMMDPGMGGMPGLGDGPSLGDGSLDTNAPGATANAQQPPPVDQPSTVPRGDASAL